MTHESLINEDWLNVVARLGGADALADSARETKAFLRPREIKNAVDLLRMILAYCLGERGLRLTAAWATSVGLPSTTTGWPPSSWLMRWPITRLMMSPDDPGPKPKIRRIGFDG